MDSIALEALPRAALGKAKALRRKGRIPAVYYGRGQQNTALELDYQKFRKAYEKAGENTIIELNINGKKAPVLIHDIQFDPVADTVSHVDFMHVDMEKEVVTSVKITAVGLAPAVKNLGGILDIQKREVKVKCLPKDLIHSIEVDVTPIVDFHTSIHVKDLKIPSAIKILDNPDDTVATVVPPKIEEEKPAVAAPAEGAAAAAPAAGGVAAPAAGTAPAGAAPAAR